ncbi:hypothetical protein [Candidatus Phytoplasma pini]|uniref:Uncharacterized protein n=1 Tax=Candidatus Phytoplasma pini TaxID=267362 RepID=A0A559KJ82_9MOLU|nr:hypothetical protein [Candidatus Phytoplasma pini]TVY12193.1 hypothetical protein MDPP_00261 [Candidatus Phytoplasma pini]
MNFNKSLYLKILFVILGLLSCFIFPLVIDYYRTNFLQINENYCDSEDIISDLHFSLQEQQKKYNNYCDRFMAFGSFLLLP